MNLDVTKRQDMKQKNTHTEPAQPMRDGESFYTVPKRDGSYFFFFWLYLCVCVLTVYSFRSIQ